MEHYIQKFNTKCSFKNKFLFYGPEIISSYNTFNSNKSSTNKKLDEVNYIFNEDFKNADLTSVCSSLPQL